MESPLFWLLLDLPVRSTDEAERRKVANKFGRKVWWADPAYSTFHLACKSLLTPSWTMDDGF
jgi:hypothetical protein